MMAALRKHFKVLLATSLIISQIGLAALTGALINQSHESGHTQLQSAALAQCHRVQRLRERLNENTKLTFIITSILTMVIAEPSLVTLLSHHDRQLRLDSVAALYTNLDGLRLDGPTNCNQAVNHPLTYHPPASVKIPPLKLP